VAILTSVLRMCITCLKTQVGLILLLLVVSSSEVFGRLQLGDPAWHYWVIPFDEAKEAADAGDAYAAAVVATYYSLGWRCGVDVRVKREDWPKLAFDYATRSARANNPLGLFRLGSLLRSGEAGPHDEATGLRYQQMAVPGLSEMADSPYALTALGILYFQGKVVPQDKIKAAGYYAKAADRIRDNMVVYAPAAHNLAIMHFNGEGVPKDKAKYSRLISSALELEYPPSLHFVTETKAEGFDAVLLPYPTTDAAHYREYLGVQLSPQEDDHSCNESVASVYQAVKWPQSEESIQSEVLGTKHRCVAFSGDPGIYIFDVASHLLVARVLPRGDAPSFFLVLSGDEKLLFAQQAETVGGCPNSPGCVISMETFGVVASSPQLYPIFIQDNNNNVGALEVAVEGKGDRFLENVVGRFDAIGQSLAVGPGVLYQRNGPIFTMRHWLHLRNDEANANYLVGSLFPEVAVETDYGINEGRGPGSGGFHSGRFIGNPTARDYATRLAESLRETALTSTSESSRVFVTSLNDNVLPDTPPTDVIARLKKRFERELARKELPASQPDGLLVQGLIYGCKLEGAGIRLDVVSQADPVSLWVDLQQFRTRRDRYGGPGILKIPQLADRRDELPEDIVGCSQLLLGDSRRMVPRLRYPQEGLSADTVRVPTSNWEFDLAKVDAGGERIAFPRSSYWDERGNILRKPESGDLSDELGGKGFYVDRIYVHGDPAELIVGCWIPIQSRSMAAQADFFDPRRGRWLLTPRTSAATGLVDWKDKPAGEILRPIFGGAGYRAEGTFYYYDSDRKLVWFMAERDGSDGLCLLAYSMENGKIVDTRPLPDLLLRDEAEIYDGGKPSHQFDAFAIDGERVFVVPLMEKQHGILHSVAPWEGAFDIYWSSSGDVLVQCTDYFYAGAAAELRKIVFRRKDRAYPFEQFDLRLNRPDIVLERLGAPAEAVAIAKQLREKRLKRMGVTEDMLKPDFHVPELEIVGDLPATTEAGEINISIKAGDSKYPLERLKVFVNNVPVNGRDGESLRDQNAQSLERMIPIKLAVGRNKIQVSVLNNAGAESLYANAEINCTAQRPKPTLYAVAMGVSEYSNPDWNLKYAAKDAQDVLARLKAKSGDQYGEVKELLITNKDVTKDNLAKVGNFLKGATIDDTVLMFAAGHGLLDSKYDYYFGTTDIDFNNPADKGIAFEEFDDILADLPCLKKSLLVDTCHAGELDEEEKTLLATASTGGSAPLTTGNEIAMRSIGTRGMNVKAIEGARGASEWYDRLQGLFVDLRRGSGSTILTSAAGAEYALESSEQQNGLFTYAVLEALDGKKDADTNKDGSVQMSELGEYVKKRVSELTNNKQTPNTRRVNLEGDFTLAKTQ
jgi:uncharacterized caspase-like protein